MIIVLLNTKTILECSEDEEEKHNQEIEDLMSSILKLPNYRCAAIIKYFDEAHKLKKTIIKECELHSCIDMIEYVDVKNGIDIANIDGFLTFLAYGQSYTLSKSNDSHFIVTGIQIMPFNTKKESINIFELIKPTSDNNVCH